MNIKIAKTMLALCIVYIIGFYVLKFIFPEYLLLAITDESLLHFGKVVESWTGYVHIVQFATTFITLYLFACASSARFKIKWIELVYLLVGTALTNLVLYLAPELYTHTSISIMLIMAMLFKGKLAYTVISFTLHGFLSQFLFSIRGFETIIMHINAISGVMMTIECWVWLVLVGIIFYLKEKNNGRILSTLSK